MESPSLKIFLKHVGDADPSIKAACLEIDAKIEKLRSALEKIEKSPQAAWEIVYVAKEALAT